MNKPLPQHDKISLSRQVFSALCVLTSAGLLVVSAVRFALTLELFPWWLPLALAAGLMAADFVSGVVHWAADTWGSTTMPLIGRRLLHPFRVHHVNPDDFLRRSFFDTNGDTAVITIPFLIVALLLPLDAVGGPFAVVFLLAFCAIGLLTNQVHQWAHMPDPPRPVRLLQDCGLILGRAAHRRHHTEPYVANYCIATGWCNRFLTAIEFFPRCERAITLLTGLTPRTDEAEFHAAHGTNHA
jgi:ubiquitin-conjugating enzyme E2 variant